MLDSLYIKNYRNLKELKINSLGKINLITGKNNTGKSTVLEAIAIYATKGYLDLIYQLLEERGETFKQRNANTNLIETNIKIFSSLFYNRIVGFNAENVISIGNLENTLSDENLSSEDNISLRFVKYIDEIHIDEQGNRTTKRKFLQNDSAIREDYKIGFEIKSRDKSYVLSLAEDGKSHYRYIRPESNDNVQFIETRRGINRDINGNLFDNVALTDKEQYVIEALKIIEPLTERIAFVEETLGERSAVIKLSDSQQILSLQSMGDGINRILTIILALVNAGNGYLLIDEFENGLHYTVQEKLWSIIFQLSKKLNIQIFATTHSEDCIKGFESVLNKSNSVSDGKLIRLDNKNGTIKQVEFDAKELKIATDQNIEIR